LRIIDEGNNLLTSSDPFNDFCPNELLMSPTRGNDCVLANRGDCTERIGVDFMSMNGKTVIILL
ncbi:unnamed protein product, partial [Rotaria magnacalcarata]